jgi:sialidase-1
VLEPGISGYTDLSIGPDGTIYCVYERGGNAGFAFERLTVARFNRAWIEAGSK